MSTTFLGTLGFALALALSALAQPAGDEHDPAVELASFQLAAGFEAKLFASEKDGVIKPIQIRFDPRGRLWVIGSTVYPQILPGQIPDDKVLILEDADGDGISDKTTVFADGLMIPTGLELFEGGAFVGHGPELLFLKDTDGDDKADERKVVLRGFGTGDNHQNINSFLWGPGGELWFCQGLHTFSNVETPWGIVRMNKAGLWRFRPGLKRLEAFYGSQHEPQNPWGYVFTDWGEPIVLAGNNHSHIYPVPGLTSSHKDLPPHLIWKNGQGRKSSGGDIVGTTHFPPEWQGLLLTGGYINNAVWALKILDDGSGFAIEDNPPLIQTTNRNFRPVDVKFGPDGALYICDWYNPIIGHYQASFRHPDRDKSRGRIWRVTAKGRPLTEPPRLHDATIPALLSQLKSADRWTRHFAKRVLADRPGSDVIKSIQKWAAVETISSQELKEALGVLQSHEIVDEHLIRRLSESPEAGARAYAASLVGANASRLSNAFPILNDLSSDSHPRVRLHVIVASSYLREPEAVDLVFRAGKEGTDKFIDYAITQAIFALKPIWLEQLKAGDPNFFSPERLNFLISRDGTADSLDAARKLLAANSLPGPLQLNLARTIGALGTAADLQMLLENPRFRGNPEVLSAVVHSAETRITTPPDVAAEVRSLLDPQQPAQIRALALNLAGAWKMAHLLPLAEAAVVDDGEAVEVRRQAIHAIGSLPGEKSRELLRSLEFDPSNPLRADLVSALGQFSLAEAAASAAEALSSKEINAADARRIFSSFLKRHGGPAALLDQMQRIPPSKETAEAGIEAMNSTGRRDEDLYRLLADVLGERTQSFTLAQIPSLVEQVRRRGDLERGREIYARPELGCVACHKLQGEGGTLGPELGTLGTAQPIDFIIGAIIDPQKEVKEGYMSISVATKDGEEFQGYRVQESSEAIVLRDSLYNEEVTIPRGRIKEIRENGSLMPSGLADSLTQQEFCDLVKFLSIQGAPKQKQLK